MYAQNYRICLTKMAPTYAPSMDTQPSNHYVYISAATLYICSFRCLCPAMLARLGSEASLKVTTQNLHR
jgi:hypothetical protein